MSIKRQIRRALLRMSDTEAAFVFGAALHAIQPVWKTRRQRRASVKRDRERRFTNPTTFNHVVRH